MRILETSKGSGVRFTCDNLDTLNREYLQLSSHYEAIQRSFIDMVIETCCELTPFYLSVEIAKKFLADPKYKILNMLSNHEYFSWLCFNIL